MFGEKAQGMRSALGLRHLCSQTLDSLAARLGGEQVEIRPYSSEKRLAQLNSNSDPVHLPEPSFL